MRLKQKAKTITSKVRANAIAKGFRSGLEEKLAQQIEQSGRKVEYECERLSYQVPERTATYRPDFRLLKHDGNFMYIESKGRFLTDDRAKHILLKKQLPNLDLRFVFSNQNSKIYKGSPTSYAKWCEHNGFMFSNKNIPEEWLAETVLAQL